VCVAGGLLATTFSATSQLARQLGEQRARAAYIHEGERFDLYAFHLDSRLSLLIIFDKRLNAGKLGTVWVYARRAMRQIQQILGR
jgi:predicted regulator of Ras-like GTPase activity (Roadblock/LC7/MglB family)